MVISFIYQNSQKQNINLHFCPNFSQKKARINPRNFFNNFDRIN